MEANALTSEEVSLFKVLFSKFCRGEINSNRCDDGNCEFCPINKAYEEIFDTLNQSDEEREYDNEM